MSFILEIGALLGLSDSDGRRLIVGLSVPTRAYAAVLAGTGAVLARAQRLDPAEADAESYFEYLGDLPKGTSVSWNNGTSKRPGVLLGMKDTPLGRRLMIQVSMSGDLREACTLESCLGVQVLDDTVKLPMGAGRRRSAGSGVPVLAKLLPGPAIFPFVSRTTLDCLMVGVGSTLTAECSEELGVHDPTSDRYLSAPIAQLLRVRVPTGAKDTYRSVIAATASAKMMQVLAGARPGVVVFDGAQAYLRWRTSWPSTQALLVLDRSEAHAEEGAAALDQDRMLYGDTEGVPEFPELPDGIEITAYWTRSEQ
jgi:hypothetical protein